MSRTLLAGLLLFAVGSAVADDADSRAFLEAHWRKAAIFYNSGLYADAAQEFEAIRTILPNDALTREYLGKCKEVANLGTRVGGEIPLKREFDLSGKKTGPVGDLPGFASPKKKPEEIPVPVVSPPGFAPAPALTKQEMEVIYTKGVSLLNAGEYKPALEQFNKILAVKPDHQPSLIRAKRCKAALRGAK